MCLPCTAAAKDQLGWGGGGSPLIWAETLCGCATPSDMSLRISAFMSDRESRSKCLNNEEPSHFLLPVGQDAKNNLKNLLSNNYLDDICTSSFPLPYIHLACMYLNKANGNKIQCRCVWQGGLLMIPMKTHTTHAIDTHYLHAVCN